MKILIQSYHTTNMISVDRGNDIHGIILPIHLELYLEMLCTHIYGDTAFIHV